jgi:hypothetical protein
VQLIYVSHKTCFYVLADAQCVTRDQYTRQTEERQMKVRELDKYLKDDCLTECENELQSERTFDVRILAAMSEYAKVDEQMFLHTVSRMLVNLTHAKVEVSDNYSRDLLLTLEGLCNRLKNETDNML